MTLSEFKTALQQVDTIQFQLPSGQSVPKHFHVTEIGKADRKFIDCGGTVREEQKVTFQLWSSIDLQHRLKSSKLLDIIDKAEKKLQIPNEEVEVEYQGSTIELYGLEFADGKFLLTATKTDCLAKDLCGIVPEKVKTVISDIQSGDCCTPGGGCC